MRVPPEAGLLCLKRYCLTTRADLGHSAPTARITYHLPYPRYVRDVGNFVAAGGGIAALGVLVVGTGGTLGGVLVAGGIAAGGWQATQAGLEMADRSGKGHDVFDLRDPTARGQWLEFVASGATAVGSTAGGLGPAPTRPSASPPTGTSC